MNSDTAICEICPRECHLKEGQRGYCFVRRSAQGKIVLDSYGRISGLCIDPIEKKPLYHFLPGSKIYSIGTVGCTLKCLFCQNTNTEVIETRVSENRTTIRRRRSCTGCKKRFTTYERVEELPILVIKRDDRRERFDRKKRPEHKGRRTHNQTSVFQKN